MLTEEGTPKLEDTHMNIIKETRKIIKDMTEEQRFKKAENHLYDALKYKFPRPQSQSLNTPLSFRIAYGIQTAGLWEWILFILGYVYMYCVIFTAQDYGTKIAVEASILGIFWLDVLLDIYCRSFDTFKKSTFSTTFICKNVFLSLMVIDLIIFSAYPNVGGRPILPFRILRMFIPMLYDAQIRKTFQAYISAHKDIFVYFIFFSTVIVMTALVGSKALSVTPSTDGDLRWDYTNLNHMIFITYTLGTYDSYPDNQLPAIQQMQSNYIFFIVFIFLNMFLFTSIPGSLIYLKFRKTRSQTILIDEIKQQHSLILAFATLSGTKQHLQIDILINWLLYVYKYKVRYVQYITDIILKVDDHNNRSIQVNEFMQLSKIILENSAMYPPKFYDWEPWVRFRKFINTNLHLKDILKHWVFELVITILIVACFVNVIFLLFAPTPLVQTFDTIFVYVFTVELVLRIVSFGPQTFFNYIWNVVDFVLIVGSFIFLFVPISNGIDGVLRLSRIFRLATLFRLVSHSNFLNNMQFQIFDKLVKLFSTILIIMPIIMRFFPLFAIVFYFFGIVGLEVFYSTYQQQTVTNQYQFYNQFSSWRNFIQSQFYMVQVLTQAGWSMVVFDYATRNASYYGLIVVYFCIHHVIITLMTATLIKGILWEVFFTVSEQFNQRAVLQRQEEKKDQQTQRKKKEYQQISDTIGNNQVFKPDTVVKRQFYQNKLDREIFLKIKEMFCVEQVKSARNIKSKRKVIIGRMMDDRHIDPKQIENIENAQSIRHIDPKQIDIAQSISSIFTLHHKPTQIGQIEQIVEEDFEEEMQNMLSHLIIDQRVKFSQTIAYPKVFVQFLQKRLIKPYEYIRGPQVEFDLNKDLLSNQQSMYYLIYQIHALLGIQTSKRQQKAMIIKEMVQNHILKEEVAENLIKKKLIERVFNIDSQGTLRKMFLSQTNEDLIKKFQIEYFSDVYGSSFKQINKMTLQPLLRFEATLTYSLRNICRYPQIDNTQFFQMLTKIQDNISNHLLKRGSLFKFVYKLDHANDIWFSIEYKKQQEMRIHFVKTGIWAYTKSMEENEVYYGRDIFYWNLKDRLDRKSCEQYLKRFYQSFEGLAFSLLNQEKFFQSNPKYHVYDLYTQFQNVQKVSRYTSRKLQISKIMVVILSKQQERKQLQQHVIDYEISDVNPNIQKKKDINFRFTDSENETFQKLKNLSAMDHERIVESEGLPFAYIINLLKQMQDIIHIYNKNIINQVQNVLNQQYEQINQETTQRAPIQQSSLKIIS